MRHTDHLTCLTIPLLCKEPQRRPSGQSVCEEHSVEPETHVAVMSRCRSSVRRAAIGGELKSAIEIAQHKVDISKSQEGDCVGHKMV